MVIKLGVLVAMVAALSLVTKISAATVLNIRNNCDFAIWPRAWSGGGLVLHDEQYLPPQNSTSLEVSPGWSGQIWATTECILGHSGSFECTAGSCRADRFCPGGGPQPVTLVDFTIGDGTNTTKDSYHISLIDGYNVGVTVGPTAAGLSTGGCPYISCLADEINRNCPTELTVDSLYGEDVVACKSACTKFRTSEYCCSGKHSTPDKCSPTRYSKMFKDACPSAYSYAYDDKACICTSNSTDYSITFCGTGVEPTATRL